MQLPVIGEEFEEKYTLLELLGEGGFARVYRARDLEVGRDVAIKVLTPSPMGYRPDVVRRFMREAKVIAGLHHPNTITMFEFGRGQHGLLYMVFEYAQGKDLSDILGERGALPADVVLHILRQLLGALTEAHAQEVLHRDIKPANVILFDYMDDAFRVKLIDFGIAKPLAERLGEPNTLTQAGVVVGTPRYMAPEQFFGEELTPAADVYSLGLVAYEMLVGTPAIDGQNQSTLVKQAVSTVPHQVPAQVASAEFRAVLERMMRRIAAERFQNAGDALQALASIRDPFPAPMRPHPQPQPQSPVPRPPTVMDPPPAPREAVSQRSPIPIIAGVALGGIALVAVLSFSQEERTTAPAPSKIPNALVRVDEPAEAVVQSVDAGAASADVIAVREGGCGVPSQSGKVIGFSAAVGVSHRSWSAYAPRGYDAHRRHPIVLVFPRTNRSSERVLQSTQFPAVADENQFFVIAFDALDPAKPWTSPDDVETINLAIDEMAQLYCLDRTQVFAVGDGAGGRFVANLGCQRPISAVATYAYGQYEGEEICVSEDGPTPTLRTIGIQDRDVPTDGGPGCTGGTHFLNASEHRKFWLDRHACDGPPRSWSKFGGGECQTFACEVPFVACAAEGGHYWPGSQRPMFTLPSCDAPVGTFPLADAMWQFFHEHGRTLHP